MTERADVPVDTVLRLRTATLSLSAYLSCHTTDFQKEKKTASE
jgi:hypothetical protein